MKSLFNTVHFLRILQWRGKTAKGPIRAVASIYSWGGHGRTGRKKLGGQKEICPTFSDFARLLPKIFLWNKLGSLKCHFLDFGGSFDRILMVRKQRFSMPPCCYGPRSNKPKNTDRLRFVKCYPCKCHDFVNQFILTIQLYYIFSV